MTGKYSERLFIGCCIVAVVATLAASLMDGMKEDLTNYRMGFLSFSTIFKTLLQKTIRILIGTAPLSLALVLGIRHSRWAKWPAFPAFLLELYFVLVFCAQRFWHRAGYYPLKPGVQNWVDTVHTPEMVLLMLLGLASLLGLATALFHQDRYSDLAGSHSVNHGCNPGVRYSQVSRLASLRGCFAAALSR